MGRTLSAREAPDWTLTPYIMQSTLLLVSPALFAASIYMILGRIILLVHGEKHSVIRLNWLTKIFVAGDVLSFVMQSSGITPSTPLPTSHSLDAWANMGCRCGNNG